MTLRISIFVAIFAALVFQMSCASRQQTAPTQTLAPQVSKPLLVETRKSYTQLFDESLSMRYSPKDIDTMMEYLEKSKDHCADRYKTKARQYDQELRRASMELYQVGGRMDDSERTNRHCEIQNLRILKARAEIFSEQSIPVAFENREAKLELIEHWPSEYGKIQQELRSGAYQNRRWANAKDIGYRVVAEDQEDDIKTGLNAIEQLRRQGAIPPEINDAQVSTYVTKLTENIARHSDLQVPVKITVLNSPEINAFALPGGFLYVQRGLLEAAESESELVGVLSHEIAHDAARHGHRLMRKANIANILLQTMKIAGAIAGGGWYYGLGYGAQGLGLVMNLNILGKSREFELEADQLGIQYAWNAGYDPQGFFTFFDKMATRKGYARSTSFFRTHPAFYERMVETRREITFLPKKDRYIVQSEDFQNMQAALKKMPPAPERMDPRAYNQNRRVSVPVRDESCAPPAETQQTGVQYLEDICGIQ